MDIYENIIIGNFLFGLGVQMGMMSAERGGVQPVSASLLQQTPLDKQLADVVLSSCRLYRIIEFKRSANTSTKELQKLSTLSQKLRDSPASLDLSNLSRRVHWYVRSDFRCAREGIDVIPYLDFRSLDHPNLSRANVLKFDEFIESTAREAVSQTQVDADEFKLCPDYLSLLETCGSGANTGCLLLTVSNDSRLLFAVVENIRELWLTRETIRDLQIEQERGWQLGL